MAMAHFFGIRHHGPGCARSLLKALDALNPDCLLIEGPPEADEILKHAGDPAMQPPVALLVHCPDEPGLASFYPLAEFSPEWQAIRWGVARGAPTRFIDLPQAHGMAMRKAALEADQQEPEAGTADPDLPPAERGDPLGWLAQAAGYGDGESWWNHVVEERGDGEDLFVAIAEAMREVRGHVPADTGDWGRREALREAYMRNCLREARKQGFERIAVVCGAWHVPALEGDIAGAVAKADAQLLKGLPKLKVAATWVPWSYPHLAARSGYGAGVASPGWYDYLWRLDAQVSRPAGWLARVARLLREEDLDCSSAHVIEGVRLAQSLAALRHRPAAGLDELNEACITVLCHGETAPLKLIERRLIVGDKLGHVPEGIPAVPLQRDIEQQQKSLRMKPEALAKTLELDLRKENDLARSHLLHRLALLGIEWGTLAKAGQSRGTFKEVWNLQWQPEFAVAVIEASRWGNTAEQAAQARAIDKAGTAEALPDLAQLIDRVLLADLPSAVGAVARQLEERAALTGDAAQLLGALPPLANVFRYGSVRQTDTALVAKLLDGIILRASIGLPLACVSLDDEAADVMRKRVLEADRAVGLRNSQEQTEAWHRALRQLALAETWNALLRGMAARLLLDAGQLGLDEAAALLGRNLSAGAEPAQAAAWLDGFLNRNAMVLLHDEGVWGLVDNWLAGLGEEQFLRVLPLVRRTFSVFSPAERRDLSGRVRRGPAAAAAAVPASWDEARAALPIPLLRTILGVAE